MGRGWWRGLREGSWGGFWAGGWGLAWYVEVSFLLVGELKMKKRVNVAVPVELKAAAQTMAAKQGVSLNRFVVMALTAKIGSSGAAEFFAERGKGGDPEPAIAMLKRVGVRVRHYSSIFQQRHGMQNQHIAKKVGV